MPASSINPLFAIEKLPTTSAAAIREFNDRYIAGVGASKADGWADSMGTLIPTDSSHLTFPVSQLRTKYEQTLGESRFKDMGEQFFDVKSQEFDDGYRADLLDLFQKVFAYRNWQQAPGRLLNAEEQHRHDCIAALLESGETETCYDGATGFFATDHPDNPAKATTTWSNLEAGPLDVVSIANIQAQVTAMKIGVLDENGRKLGVKPDTIIVPSEKVEALTNLLAQSLILDGTGTAAVDNVYKGRFTVQEAKELTDVDDWYLADSKLLGELTPWVSMRQNVPMSLALRWFDEQSDYFKETGKIKVSSHIWYGFALAIPHAIRKIKGA